MNVCVHNIENYTRGVVHLWQLHQIADAQDVYGVDSSTFWDMQSFVSGLCVNLQLSADLCLGLARRF